MHHKLYDTEKQTPTLPTTVYIHNVLAKYRYSPQLETADILATKSSTSLWRKLSWDRSTLWSVDRRYVMYLRLCILQRDLDSLKRWNNAWGMKFNMKMSNSVHRQWTSHPTYLSICTTYVVTYCPVQWLKLKSGFVKRGI